MKKWFRAEKRRDESFETHSGLFDLAYSDTSGPWSRPRRFTTGPTALEPGVTGGGVAAVEAPPPAPAPKVATQVLERFVEPALEVSTARIRPLWSRVADLVTGEAPAGLRALVRCNHTSIERHFVCGTSAPHVDAWCGAAHCPRCSHHAAAEAGAAARTSWPERVLVARATIASGPARAPQGGATLPTPDEVLGARGGWGKVAAGLGLDPFGLAVVVPGAVLFFVGAPDGGTDLAFRVVEKGGSVGLQLSAEVGGCDAAASALEDALTLEARRFEEVVARGVTAGDLGPAIELVTGRDPKRTVVFASKRGLPCPATRKVRATPRPCPIHGGCDADGTVVLHGSIEVARAKPLPDQPTRQAVLGLF